MITYKLINDKYTNQLSGIKRNDGLCIPICDDNTDYQAYLKWLAEGNTPEPAENT
jgi:hypothetical protein